MDEWMDRFAGALGEEPVAPAEAGLVLRLAREVAHGAERKLAPLSTYLAGVHAGRRLGEGMQRETALRLAVDAARGLLPTGEDADGDRAE
jgi:hypothetical protein